MPPTADPGAPAGLVEQLASALQDHQRSARAFDDAVGRRLDLRPSDLRCLDRLCDGPLTAGRLGEATGLRPAATTTLVDRLARRGLVRRRRLESDARVVLVEVTPRGEQLVLQAYGPLAAAVAPVLQALSPDQLRLVTDHLRRVTAVTDAERARLEAHVP